MASSAPRAAILIVDDNQGKRLAIISVLEALGQHDRRSRLRRSRAACGDGTDVRRDPDGRPDAGHGRLRDGRAASARASDSEHTPIIFVTAHAAEEAQIPIAYESGAVDFIFAPIVPVVLRAKVSIFVELFLSRVSWNAPRARFRDSEERIRAVLENVAEGIVTVGDDGRDPVVQSRGDRAVRLLASRRRSDSRSR